MPLKRADLALTEQPVSFEIHLTALGAADADTRRRAASALGHHEALGGADARILAALAAQLHAEPDTFAREAMFAAIGNLGGGVAAALLGPFLRLDDAALRNGAVETLKHLGEDAVPAVDALLTDPDPDVRLLAIEVLRGWPPALVMPRLRALLAAETHVNVMGVALDVAAAAGDAALLPALEAARTRFADNAFIAFAVTVVMDKLPAPPAAAPAAQGSKKSTPNKSRKPAP